MTITALLLDYACRATGEVDGLEWAAGQRLLQRLQDQAEAGLAPRYAHRWKPHDCLLWDNITTQHAASADFPVGEKRTMWRALLEGGRPQLGGDAGGGSQDR
eukprot:SAG22_NODE_2574_length_2425_cov_2.925623_3_plen_102_part_00